MRSSPQCCIKGSLEKSGLKGGSGVLTHLIQLMSKLPPCPRGWVRAGWTQLTKPGRTILPWEIMVKVRVEGGRPGMNKTLP